MAAQILLCIRFLQITHSANATNLIDRNSCLKYADCNSRHIFQYWRSEAIIKNYLSDARNQSNVTSYLTTTYSYDWYAASTLRPFAESIGRSNASNTLLPNSAMLHRTNKMTLDYISHEIPGLVSTTPLPLFCRQTYALQHRLAT